jgi:hypothetical protein
MNEKNDNKEEIIENSNEKKENIETNTFYLPRIMRLIFFILFIILTSLFNIEAMGLISEELKYKTFYLKMFSFLILCLFPITQYDKMKSIMMFIPSIILLYFNLTFIEISSTFLSLLSFFTKIYALAYLRIWIDQFSMIKYKTLFIYILNIIALFGDKISIMTTQFISFKHNAAKILLVQFLIFMFLFFTPNKYFFVHKQFKHYHKKIQKKIDINIKDKKSKDNVNENDDFDIVSVFENIQSEEVEKETDKGKDKKNKFNHIFKIFLNSCYISSILGKVSIYYIIAVIDYALVDHCEKVLNEEEKDRILNNYEILISILSISGSVFGGILSIIVGGYEEIKSCIVVAISNTVTILATFCLFYSNSYFTIYISLCFLFFFMNISMGNLEGYIIQSIPLKYIEFGLNFCGLMSTIGCFIARSIYDYIKITFDKTNPFYAWRFCLACFLFGYFSILLACTFRYRDLNKINLKKKKEIEMDEFDNENEYENDDDDDENESYNSEKNSQVDFKKLRRKTFDSVNS